MTNTEIMTRHPVEDEDSWNAYLVRHGSSIDIDVPSSSYRRRLSNSRARKESDSKHHHDKHHHDGSNNSNDDSIDPIQLEKLKFEEDLRKQQVQQASDDKKQSKAEKKRLEAYNAVYQSPGIARTSVHGLMVSTCT